VRTAFVTALLAACFAAAAPAQTSPHRHHHDRHAAHHRLHEHRVASKSHHGKLAAILHRVKTVHWSGPDIRPTAWCGWYMRQIFHVADRSYNWAPNWAQWGHASFGPQVGAVVVWTYHVGLIAGGPDKQGRWLVKSGNDGNAVRTRYLSIAKAIAFRMP